MDLDRRLWAKRLGEGGLDVTDREGSDEARDHERLEGVGPAHTPVPGSRETIAFSVRRCSGRSR